MLTSHELDQTQQSLQASVLAVGTAASGETGLLHFTERWWKDLGDLGVLALATEAGGGTASDLVAAHEALGRQAAPGPLGTVVVAAQLAGPRFREAVHTGEILVGLRVGCYTLWAPPAQFYLELEDGCAWWCETASDVEVIDTMASDPWGRSDPCHREELGRPEIALTLSDLATAAYLVGAGLFLLELTAQHAKSRHQFGRTIGSFQGVAHPLAKCEARLMTARQLLFLTAHQMSTAPSTEGGSSDTGEGARSAQLAFTAAERAALDTAFMAHQVHGAMGFAAEAPVGHYSARIRQVSLTCAGRARKARMGGALSA